MKRAPSARASRIRRRGGVSAVSRPAARILAGTVVAWQNRTRFGLRSYTGHVVAFYPGQHGEPGDIRYDHYTVQCADRIRCVPASILEPQVAR